MKKYDNWWDLLFQKKNFEREEPQRFDDKLFDQSKNFAVKFPIYYKTSTKK